MAEQKQPDNKPQVGDATPPDKEAALGGFCIVGGVRIPVNQEKCIDGQLWYCYPTGSAIYRGDC